MKKTSYLNKNYLSIEKKTVKTYEVKLGNNGLKHITEVDLNLIITEAELR